MCLPRIVDVALSGAESRLLRGDVTRGLEGDVLEIGFGSGRNVPLYPPTVRRVLAVEPSGTGRKLARRRIAASPVAVDFVGLDGEHLPVDDGSVDHVLSTWTLCTIPDVNRALAEVARVLRPGGTLHFLEHGLAADARVARLQAKLTPLQRRVFGGCHLDRPIDRLVEVSPLVLTRLCRFAMKGPKTFGSMYQGVATKPVPAA